MLTKTTAITIAGPVDIAAVTAVDIRWDAVAYGLSRIARFAGGTRGRPYSVAQHSCIGACQLMAATGNARIALAFLVHDAEEAFIGDMPRPLRELLTLHGYGAALTRALAPLRRALAEAAGLTVADLEHDAVVEMDARMAMTEMLDLTAAEPAEVFAVHAGRQPLTRRGPIGPLAAESARQEWLQRFEELTAQLRRQRSGP